MTLFFNHTVIIPLRGKATLVLPHGQQSCISCETFPLKTSKFW